jgi:hypothetical protein
VHKQRYCLWLRRQDLAAVCLAAWAFTACGEAPNAPAADRVRPEYDKSGKLARLEYDRTGDGKVDTWGYMDGSRVVRVEIDEDGDGKVDRWEYHRPGTSRADPSGAPSDRPDKTVERIERATRRDGRVNRRCRFPTCRWRSIQWAAEPPTDG